MFHTRIYRDFKNTFTKLRITVSGTRASRGGTSKTRNGVLNRVNNVWTSFNAKYLSELMSTSVVMLTN